MLKKLIFSVLLFYTGLSHSSPSDVSTMGAIAMFEKPLEIAVTVIEKAHGLVYWALPLEVDSKGIAEIKKFVKESRTNNVMDDPFLFQFRLAGIETAVEDGTDLNDNKFMNEVNSAIEKTVEGTRFVLKCYGYFTYYVVPFCDAYDRNGESAIISLISQGMAVPNSQLGIVDDEQRDLLEQALNEAKKAQVGTWRPFNGFFSGF